MQKSILSEILRRFDHNHGSDNLNWLKVVTQVYKLISFIISIKHNR
jgi:hypothetical protein